MGVPKFYRWISERYPCLSEVVKENQIPEFDNLYLDMNGIIHTCSHPNDEDVHFRMPEEKMFKDIFHYIEVLFRIVRPRKVFFMAVDGVAPRAKMNQQRGRRFRSAKEAISREKEAIAKGEVLPKEKRFDSNCITPGTDFMVRLQKQLVYFVNQKLTNDRLWQGIRVYLSGHETPGEGEHKIMDFIRSEKCSKDYDPNTRHCLYGLDADLIMLGLVSHEPHFSLLREEVRFGKQGQSQRPTTPEETTFHLLHLSLLREYLAEEFIELRSLPWYDIESIIDDWIMMGFLVGNDFIPNLPNMHINHGALPDLYRIYSKLLPSLNGYINDNGKLHLRRFETFLKALSQHDEDSFKQSMEEFDYLTSKTSKEAWKSQRVQKKREEKEMRMKLAEQNMILKHAINYDSRPIRDDLDDDNDSVDSLAEQLKNSGLQIMDFSDTSDEDCDTAALELKMKKRQYYRDKLEKDVVSDEEVMILALEYVRAIQWILHYYYNGVQSWSWYYPFHYAPYVSDITGFSNMKLEYEMSRPFLPFQQLLAVLPAASKELLPVAYQGLMYQPNSPIIDYYPEEFEEDLNGKQQSWEAVVKIPFIDEKRLLAAMADKEKYLKESEIKRNTHSEHLLFLYQENLTYIFPSSLPGHFPDIQNCHAKCMKIPLDAFWLPKEKIRKGLCKGVKLGVYFPGFPTLHHLKFESELKKDEVKVFQQNSRGDNVILKIVDTTQFKKAREVYAQLLGKLVYAEWPHLKEVRVVAVSDDKERFELVEAVGANQRNMTEKLSIRRRDLTAKDVETFYDGEISVISSHYHKRKGVVIGQTSVLVYGCPLLGRKYSCGDGGVISLEKQWAPSPQVFAHQMIVKDITVHDASFKQLKTLSEVFPKGTECFMLGNPYYGALGKVLETKEEKVMVEFIIPPEPDFHHIMRREQKFQMQYFPAHVIARELCVSSHIVSRITGTIFVSKGPPPSTGADLDSKSGSRINVGLNLKFNKAGEEVPSYTKKKEEGATWQYSSKVLDVLRDYMVSFPEIFDMLSGTKSQSDAFYETDVFGDSSTRLKELKEWLAGLECNKVAKAKIGQLALDEPIIALITDEVDKTSLEKPKKVKVMVRPHLLHRPFDYQGNLIPDPQATYQLYDRVINVREGYSVPLGLKGVVVGIQDGATILDSIYEVVFDEEFVGGLKLRCDSCRGYRMSASSLMNISYGSRKGGRNEKPLAVVKPQQNDVKFFNPTSTSHHTQQQTWYANKINRLGTKERDNRKDTSEAGHGRVFQQTSREAPSRTKPVREHEKIATPPSFASMFKPGPAQANPQKQVPQEDIKAGTPKFTILSRKDETSGKKVLRKRERPVKTKSNLTGTEGPSDESSTSSATVTTSPEQSVSPPVEGKSPPPGDNQEQERGNTSRDTLSELWEKFKEGNTTSGMPNPETAGIPRQDEPVFPEDDRDRGFPNGSDGVAAEDIGARSGVRAEQTVSDDPLSPHEIWDEDSDDVILEDEDGDDKRLEEIEQERMTPNTYAKMETKEKLCQLLNLSHITGRSSLESTEPPMVQQLDTGPHGKRISFEELLAAGSSKHLDAPSNAVPPPNTNLLFPSGAQQNLFPGVISRPEFSPNKQTGPPHGMQKPPDRLPGPLHPPPGLPNMPVARPSNLPEKSAFQPVPQQALNQPSRYQIPAGFYHPKQRPQIPFGMMAGHERIRGMVVPGVGLMQSMGAQRQMIPHSSHYQQFQGKPQMVPNFSTGPLQPGLPETSRGHPLMQGVVPLPGKQRVMIVPGNIPQRGDGSLPNLTPGAGPNSIQQSGPNQGNTSSTIATGTPRYPPPVGHQQLGQPMAKNFPPSSVPPSDGQRSPPGQPGYPPLSESSKLPSTSGGGGVPSADGGQQMDTMLNKLRAYCSSKGLKHPNYEYVETDIAGQYFVIIYLPIGQVVSGDSQHGRRNALEVAAFKALRIMHQICESPEFNQPPKSSTAQFIPLQVTKKLTPQKPSNSVGSSDLYGNHPKMEEESFHQEEMSKVVYTPADLQSSSSHAPIAPSTPPREMRELTSHLSPQPLPHSQPPQHEAEAAPPTPTGGPQRARGRRQGGKGGAKLAINFGGSG